MVFEGKARRMVIAVAVVFVLAWFVREAVAQHIPTPEVCKRSTPDDWEWWSNGCWNYPSAAPLRILVR